MISNEGESNSFFRAVRGITLDRCNNQNDLEDADPTQGYVLYPGPSFLNI